MRRLACRCRRSYGCSVLPDFSNHLASSIDTSFIVLQHDIHEATVDLAVGYTLDAALSHNPPYTLKAIGECTKTPVINLYLETTQNSTFPYPNRTQVNVDGHGETGITKGAGELNSAMSIQNSILTVLLAVAAATSILSLFS
ncbi:chitin deacetylase [Leucoagaricus gongylophorus]